MKKISLMCLSLFVLSSHAHALDNKWMESHLRKNFSIDTRTPIVIGEFTPAPIGDLLVGKVTIGSNEFPVYLTKDEKNYFWGNVYDLTIDPDKEREKKIDLTNVHFKGSSKAKITLVEYSDMQCPYCQKAHEMISADLYKTYTKNQVRVVFKQFPLGMHDWAETAAVAAECAGEQGNAAFWGMTDIFFKESKDITAANVKEKQTKFVKDLKLNEAKFNKCVEGGEAMKRVQAQKQEGTSVGVSGTPTLYVNGRMVRGAGKIEDLKVVIDEKLAEIK